jgi:hypothetical protein
MSQNYIKYLNKTGIKFPETASELDEFADTFEDFNYSITEEDVDPYKILREAKAEKSISKPTNKDYFKRTVLAAEILIQLNEDNHIGHLKLQKLLFLCQNSTNMILHTNFLKQAMGPYDPRLMRSIDIQLEKQQWFKYNGDSFPKYKPLEKCGTHSTWFNRFFNTETDKIYSLIETFRLFSSDQIEIVATLFACWKKAIKENYIISDSLLIKAFYDWDPSKNRFSENQLINAIGWMKEKGIYPVL